MERKHVWKHRTLLCYIFCDIILLGIYSISDGSLLLKLLQNTENNG